jgi:hypothetical protein
MHADYVLRPEEYADGSSADVGAGIFCILLRSVLPCEKYSTVGEQAQRYYECNESFVKLIGAAAASYAEYVQLLGQYERTRKTSPVNGCALSVMGTTRSSRQEASLIGPLRVPILGCGERQRIFMSQAIIYLYIYIYVYENIYKPDIRHEYADADMADCASRFSLAAGTVSIAAWYY